MTPPSSSQLPPERSIRVFVADDHAVVRRGLEALIGTEAQMVVVGTAANGREAVAGIVRTEPDVVLLDLKMPELGGVEVIARVKALVPAARVLILTSFGDSEHVFAAVKQGALGYLLKDTAPEALLQAIRDVHAGRVSLHPDVALKLIRELQAPPSPPPEGAVDPLTAREVEVLRLIARGWTNQQIASYLVVSERTVRTHASNILGKLHLANRTQAALYALREGLARLEDATPPPE